AIETAVAKLKETHKAEDISGLDKAMEDLNAAWQAASQHIYNAQQQQGGGDGAGEQTAGNNDGGVADAEYEEVK
ncbi:hypothetical protein OFC49_31995, partial [Escherichia coli]|nr:hypothetical protein [Escherichia coli]